jgi:alkaline phosphatase
MIEKRLKTKISAVLICLLSVTLLYAAASCGSTHQKAFLPRHIILFIGDGMHLENEIAASRYLYGSDRALSFHAFPYKGYAATWDITTYNRYAANSTPPGAVFSDSFYQTPESLAPLYGYNPAKGGAKPFPDAAVPESSYFTTALADGTGQSAAFPATDSAAAASAIATGRKYRAGVISWDSGTAVETVLEKVRNIGNYQTGIISTVPFSHATPAAFAAHAGSRSSTTDIASEIIHTTAPDIVIGGGHPQYYSGGYAYISAADYNSLRNGGTEYLFAERTAGTSAESILGAASDKALSDGKKMFALFGGSEGNFGYADVTSDRSSVITPQNNENPPLSLAVTTALKIFSSRGGSFFLLAEQGDIDWANHATDYRKMISSVNDLHLAVKAASDFVDIPGDDIDWSNTLIIVTADHANGYFRLHDPSHAALGKGILPAQTSSPVTYPGGEVSYGTPGSHTNEPVTLYSKGTGSELFAEYEGVWYPGTTIIDNTQIYRVITGCAGITR